MQVIDREELLRLERRLGDLVVAEVLNEDEYRSGHLPGALSLPLGEEFEAKISRVAPEKSRPIAVYCQSPQCLASDTAAEQLERLGYENVYVYRAGKEDWQSADLPLRAGDRP